MSGSDFKEFVMTEVLSEISGTSARAMFGGYGIYAKGVMFALIANDRLYLKVDDSLKKEYEAAGTGPFVYGEGNHKPSVMSYYEMPPDGMESPAIAAVWAEKSLKAALKLKTKKGKKSSSKKKSARKTKKSGAKKQNPSRPAASKKYN